MSEKGDHELADEKSTEEGTACHPRYIYSFPGVLRVFNIILGGVILGFWIPGYEHDYQNPSQIINFRDITKHYGAGYKTETLNQFALADIIISLIISTFLLGAIVVVPHSFVDLNRLNRISHVFLTVFHGIGAVCGCVGVWYFQENCCRVELEWNGVGFRYKPAVRELGYLKHNGHCNCWLTKRASGSNQDGETSYSYTTALWEPYNYPANYEGEEQNFVSFSAHHVHIHTIAAILMILNTGIYALCSIFTKPSLAK